MCRFPEEDGRHHRRRCHAARQPVDRMVIATPVSIGGQFATVFGRELIGELPNFVHRPYLVVTMADLWPRFEHLFDSHLAGVHLVETLDTAALETAPAGLPEFASCSGLGGGQAGEVPKFFPL